MPPWQTWREASGDVVGEGACRGEAASSSSDGCAAMSVRVAVERLRRRCCPVGRDEREMPGGHPAKGGLVTCRSGGVARGW